MQKVSYTLECFKGVVDVYFSVFLVVRPPDALCLLPSIVSKWRGLRELDVLVDRADVQEAVREVEMEVSPHRREEHPRHGRRQARPMRCHVGVGHVWHLPPQPISLKA